MKEHTLRCSSGVARLHCQHRPRTRQRRSLRVLPSLMQADKPSNGLSSAVQTMSRLVQTISGGPEPYKRQHQYEQSVTFLTSEGLVQLPVLRPPRKVQKLRQQAPLPTWQEQGLCIGNSFWVTATNGLDICRRLNLLGYCRCTELLSDVVEETVLQSGGEVVAREYQANSGLHESLHMTVAIPLLWGIPPRHEALSIAIASGGGFVDKVYKQWQLYGQT